MKITYIVSSFPKLSETFVLNQITGLIDRGHEVEIIAFGRQREDSVHEDVHRYNLLAKTHYVVKNQSSLGIELNERIVQALFFTDLLHAHFTAWPAEAALKLSKMFGIPFVFTAHAYDIFIGPDPVAMREKFDMAARVITVSYYNKEYLLDLLGSDLADKIEVIRCGIDIKRFGHVKRSPGDTVKILFVGRLVEKKGAAFAIEAFGEVLKENPNVELRLIGDGPLKDEVVDLIKRLDLKGKALMLGPLPQSEVLKEINGADIFLLPSITAENGDREGVPVSIMEAQATGLPVVSSVHTGIPEVIIDGKTGLLFPEKDVSAIAMGLNRLVKDPGLRNRMGKSGRDYIRAHFEHKEEIRALEGLFKGLFKTKAVISTLSKRHKQLLNSRVGTVVLHMIEYRGDQLRRMDDQIKMYDERLKKLEEVTKRIGEIAQKDERLKALNAEVKKKDESIAGLKDICAERDEKIRRNGGRIKGLEEGAKAWDVEISGSRKALEKDERVKSLEAELKANDKELRQLRQYVEEIQKTKAYKIYTSITKPFKKKAGRN